MPKVGTTRAFRFFADRFYLDRANRDTYLERNAAADIGLSGNLVLPALKTVDGVDLSVHAADLDAHIRDFRQEFVVGDYYTFAFPTVGTGTRTMTANRLWGHFIFIPRPLTVDRIAIQVTTLADPSTIRLLIYNVASGLPTSLLLNAGTVNGATTGQKTITISQALARGIYFPALISGQAPVVKSHGSSIAWGLLGVGSDWTYPNTNTYLKETQDPATPPDPFPASPTKWDDENTVIVFRIASLD